MVAQPAYEAVVDDFFKTLSEEELELRNCAGTLYTYNGGAWGIISAAETARFEQILYTVALEQGFPIAEKMRGLWLTLKLRAPLLDYELLDEKTLLALPNGTLDPKDGTLYPHDPDHYTTRRLAIEYDPEAECPEWLLMLDRIFSDKSEEAREEHKTFLQEFFGMALCGFKPGTARDLRKALILYGESGTAKTSVAEVLRRFFRTDEVCAENIDQLSKDYGLASLVAARALISDDAVGKKSTADPKTLKKLITGEPLTANRKYKDKQDFRFRGPIVFTTNVKPEIKDESDALFNRTVLLTFDYQFTKEDKERLGMYREVVPYLEAHDEFSGILNWAIQGMTRALEIQRYSAIAEASESSRVWRAENDVCFDFLSKFAVADKKAYCSVPLLSRVISLYAEEEHHVRRDDHSPKKTSNRLVREVRSTVKGTKVVRMDRSDVSGNVIVGLRINDEGLAWEKMAKERGLVLPGVRWRLNGKVL